MAKDRQLFVLAGDENQFAFADKIKSKQEYECYASYSVKGNNDVDKTKISLVKNSSKQFDNYSDNHRVKSWLWNEQFKAYVGRYNGLSDPYECYMRIVMHAPNLDPMLRIECTATKHELDQHIREESIAPVVSPDRYAIIYEKCLPQDDIIRN
jgi:hypothetical protein